MTIYKEKFAVCTTEQMVVLFTVTLLRNTIKDWVVFVKIVGQKYRFTQKRLAF